MLQATQEAVESLKDQMGAIQQQLAHLQPAQNAEAARITAEAKRKATAMLHHAALMDKLSTSAVALAHTNTAALQRIGSVAREAVDDMGSVANDPLADLKEAQLQNKVSMDEAAMQKKASGV